MPDLKSITPGSVTVLIGENGSGKSLELRRLCLEYLAQRQHVLAIAPSIFDRFQNIRKRSFNFFGGRQGRNAARKIMRSVLQRVSRERLQVLKQVTQALRYTRFDPMIGIKLTGDLKAVYENAQAFSRGDDEQLVSMVRRWQREADKDGMVRLHLDSHSVMEISTASFAVLANYEQRLRERGVKIEYFLFRNRTPIPLTNACSGEILFISSVAFIAARIRPGAVILIDEPETSLHPTWQKNYIETLFDLFSYYEPRIVISTHSPIIISGSEAASRDSERTRVYEMANQLSRPFDHHGMSLEQMYDELFGLITPKSHYLSQRAVALLNDLSENKRSLRDTEHEIGELRRRSYDPEQQAAFESVLEMAQKIARLRGKKERG